MSYFISEKLQLRFISRLTDHNLIKTSKLLTDNEIRLIKMHDINNQTKQKYLFNFC
jgi:hypothetical protein